MIPSSLLPKYLAAKLFIDSDQLNKAKQTADDILNSPIKVESSATKEIIREHLLFPNAAARQVGIERECKLVIWPANTND